MIKISEIIERNTQPLPFLQRGATVAGFSDENGNPPRVVDNPRKGNKRKLFLTAFLQVFLVTANTYFVSRVAWLGIAVCGFGISYIWTLNVKRISASNTAERIAYSTGAMLGGLLGVFVSKFIITRINS